MTKILYVYGDDYAALSFENLQADGKVSARELWDQSELRAGRSETYDMEDDYFEYKALEFGDIDPEFIEWVQSAQDYDAAKNANFYVVE